MQVIIEVTGGPAAGVRMEMPPGKPVVVGRLAECGFVIPDPFISRRHCEILHQPPNCTIKNLSSNGTRVNGKSIQETQLEDGDSIILSEQTQLQVQFRENAAGEESTAAVVPAAGPEQKPTGSEPSQKPDQTLHLLTGLSLPLPPAEAILQLATEFPLYQLVDFNKLEDPNAPVENPEYFFDWLPEETRVKCSPVFLSPEDEIDVAALITDSWGHDALVCVFSRQDRPALLDQLRRVAGMVAGPGVLESQLTLGDPETISNLFPGVDGFLFEEKSGETCAAFCTLEFQEALEKLQTPANG